MTATATEADSLEETWLEKTPACELGTECPHEAVWLLTIICKCRKQRYRTCEPCRQWLAGILKSLYHELHCQLCHDRDLEITWLPL